MAEITNQLPYFQQFYPEGRSVNDHVPEAWRSFEYVTLNKAIETLLQQGQHVVQVKSDLADTFRHTPVASSDHWLLGLHRDNEFWIDLSSVWTTYSPLFA